VSTVSCAVVRGATLSGHYATLSVGSVTLDVRSVALGMCCVVHSGMRCAVRGPLCHSWGAQPCPVRCAGCRLRLTWNALCCRLRRTSCALCSIRCAPPCIARSSAIRGSSAQLVCAVQYAVGSVALNELALRPRRLGLNGRRPDASRLGEDEAPKEIVSSCTGARAGRHVAIPRPAADAVATAVARTAGPSTSMHLGLAD
jgi:hypothetical protein